VLRDEAVDLFPVVLIGADALTVAADRHQSAQLFHLRQGVLELLVERLQLGVTEEQQPLALAERPIRFIPLKLIRVSIRMEPDAGDQLDLIG
jgi:hypothetical protein